MLLGVAKCIPFIRACKVDGGRGWSLVVKRRNISVNKESPQELLAGLIQRISAYFKKGTCT